MGGTPGRTRPRAMWPWAVVAASLLPAAAFGLLQLREGAAVDRYLRSRGLAGLPVNRATALQVSHAVRADFEVDPTKWKALDYGRRPFLRRDTESLLRVREGECGQGTRVLVNLLERLGFDATRLTLYDTHLQSAHTLVSIRLAEGELLVDSINTPAEMNAFLDRAGLSTQDFLLLHYTDDIESRHRFARELAARDTGAVDSTRTAFFDRYRVYSYEALPLTKLLTRAGVDVRVFNLARPARWISSLAEKPRAILGVMCLALALAFDAALLLALRARDRAASRA